MTTVACKCARSLGGRTRRDLRCFVHVDRAEFLHESLDVLFGLLRHGVGEAQILVPVALQFQLLLENRVRQLKQ